MTADPVVAVPIMELLGLASAIVTGLVSAIVYLFFQIRTSATDAGKAHATAMQHAQEEKKVTLAHLDKCHEHTLRQQRDMIDAHKAIGDLKGRVAELSAAEDVVERVAAMLSKNI